MRLASISIKNFKCIDSTEKTINIDKIVVLIGSNNAGKSTILDAYEAFASSGKELDGSYFHNGDTSLPIEITGTFNDVSAEDEAVIGEKWTYDHDTLGRCITVRWVWSKENTKGIKQSFNSSTKSFEDGGMGGFDSLIKSRIPTPIRIRPTDSGETIQTKIVALLKDHVKANLKANSKVAEKAFEEIERLTATIYDTVKEEFDRVSSEIATSLSSIFPNTALELVPKSKNNIDEKIIGSESYLSVRSGEDESTPLALQGTGLQRALLWSALSVMSSAAKKPGKADAGTKASAEQKILLIDEPEAFLHPPSVRSARESLYDFALNNQDWQVVATSHSPIFIDVSKSHTTIIRVDSKDRGEHYISTDKVSFSGDERAKLQMVRACNPIVNEFFFHEKVILVEGPTEQIALQKISEKMGVEIHIINCMGKANIPLFARILNHFKVEYVIVHDSDTPKIIRKGKVINSGMWSVNKAIRDVANEDGLGHVFTQFPHFEGFFLGESLTGGKVDRVLEILLDDSSAEYRDIFQTYSRVINLDKAVFNNKDSEFDYKRDAYVKDVGLEKDPLWS